jgi:uncharacterized protein YecE (DUF72 family)
VSRASGAGTANSPRPGRLFIGTSGWQYRHWFGPFYPEKPRPRDLLAFYAERFDTVEVNGTFYRLASAAACRRWREVTGPTFTFACKGSRYLTHMRRLKETGQGIERFFAPLWELEGKLGPIVFQLPERFAPDLDRLTAFMAGLPQPHRYAFEFRNADWFRDDVLERLAEHAAALCLYDFEGRQAPLRITADFVYIRLHGPGAKYSGKYDQAALAAWADRMVGWRERGLDTYCYFDNDAYGYSASNAIELMAMLGLSG